VIYSVWNQAGGRYDYFEDRTPDDRANAPAPKHLKQSATLGLAPEEAMWPLPSGAKRKGSGDKPVGRIARRGNGGALGDDLGGFEVSTPIVALLAIWGVTWYLWRQR
jgi:hypothetical protein